MMPGRQVARRLPATLSDVGNYDMGHVWESIIHSDVEHALEFPARPA